MARLSQQQIADDNRFLALRHQHFRMAADALVDAWLPLPTVLRIALIGSVARPLWKEVPRFGRYRRAGIELWHECKGYARDTCNRSTLQTARHVDPLKYWFTKLNYEARKLNFV